jgi:hypothetical protein
MFVVLLILIGGVYAALQIHSRKGIIILSLVVSFFVSLFLFLTEEIMIPVSFVSLLLSVYPMFYCMSKWDGVWLRMIVGGLGVYISLYGGPILYILMLLD